MNQNMMIFKVRLSNHQFQVQTIFQRPVCGQNQDASLYATYPHGEYGVHI